MRRVGIQVDTLDKYTGNPDIPHDFMDYDFDIKYDIVLCSHVLEHQRNVGIFLDKIYDVLHDNGLLLLSVPKHPADTLIEGHLSCFRTAYFIQHILHSGFDLKRGKFLSCGTIENSAILPKRNYSMSERTNAGYKWTEEHKDRSFIPLEQFRVVPNDGYYFYNCKLFPKGSSYPKGSVIQSGKDLVYRGVTLTSSRWGLTFEL